MTTPTKHTLPMKKKYITHIDRTLRGKEWWSTFGSTKFIRTLTDEEAATLDNIEEVPEPKPFEKIVDEALARTGKLACIKCGSKKGFYIYKMNRGKQSGWYVIYRCPDCGAREKKTERLFRR